MRKIWSWLNRKIYISINIIKEEGILIFLKKLYWKIFSNFYNLFKNFKKRKYLDELKKTLIKYNKVIIIISGVKINSYSGGRTIWLTKEFSKREYLTLFIYFTWRKSEWKEIGLIKRTNIFLLPLGLFTEQSDFILNLFKMMLKKIFIIEAPFLQMEEILPLANAMNFITIYDIKDDWEEFNKQGEAPWYSKDIENFICKNCNLVITVSPGLKEKFSSFNPVLIPNGFDPFSFQVIEEHEENENIENNNKIIIGYFGHLTTSWFDWELIFDTARDNKDFVFHIIGSGASQEIYTNLPENIIYHGKIEHKLLTKYTKNWNVGIIPFKDIPLSKNADPVKIYEYLYLKLPVVVTGIPNLRSYPYTFFAKNKEEFEKFIRKAKDTLIDTNKVNDFISKCTWEKRVDILEDLINKTILLKNEIIISQWSLR